MERVEWEASEYTIGRRGTSFYIAFTLAVLSLGALAVLIRSWTFLAVIVVAAVALIVHTMSKPPIVKYSISKDLVKINDREYALADFKSYSLSGTGAKPTSIIFIPKKRFGTQTELQLPKDFDIKKVQKLLEAKLPEVASDVGLLDTISSKIRGQ
ncbi:hypothetical protein FWC63_00810 [Candidatus Saccharibacteria bacterium]|nr:hypothetical protein [Candidatus Saccharibacteria bacterium]